MFDRPGFLGFGTLSAIQYFIFKIQKNPREANSLLNIEF